MKKLLILTGLLVFAGVALWAAGGRDANESRTAQDPSGFTDSIDISGKKSGKYNYYLEATDRAGNITLSGPENIFIDPESDLPRTTIINPIPNMRVQGNLNLVGIAFDDDGIQKVELAITRGNDGKGEELIRVTASGRDYWSYFLDTTNPEIWTDGFYTVTAWATDINGLSGIAEQYGNGENVPVKAHKKAVVYWQLDRKKPEITVRSHEVGALVMGNIRLRGIVTDGNGIDLFSYSTDGGERYTPVRTALDRKTGEYNWEININTKQFDDGPAVIWFQGRDSNGSIGNAAHLLFSNNTGPEVGIVYPDENASVNGIFSMAGYAKHPIGVSKLTWKAGTASGEIDLLPGNNWWSVGNIDLRNVRGNSVDVEIRAEDVSGNVTTVRRKIRIDAAADLPVVTLVSPAAGVINNELGIIVKGSARDNNGVAFINYTLNGASFAPIPCTGYFQFVIPMPAEGTYNLEVWATDINGVSGNKVQVRGIIVPPLVIQPSIVSFTSGRSPAAAFSRGMTVNTVPTYNSRQVLTGTERITMQVAFRASAMPVNATVTIGEREPVPLRLTGTRDVFNATVDFYTPPSIVPPEGKLRIQLNAVDRQGREAEHVEFIYFRDMTPQTQTVNVFNPETQLEEPQTRIIEKVIPFDFELVLGGTRNPVRLPDGRILLKTENELLTGVSSLPINNITVVGNSNIVAAEERDRHQVRLRALQEGDIGQFSLRLELENGNVQTVGPYRVLAGFNAPAINVIGTAEYSWHRTSVPLRFSVAGRTRVTAIEFSTDMGDTWVNIPVAATGDYNRSFDISGIDDGTVSILIRAANEAGKRSFISFPIQKDNTPARARLVMPTEGEKVNGTIRIAFAIEEAGTLSTINYIRPARAGAAAITREIFNADTWDQQFTIIDQKYAMRFIEVTLDSQNPLDQMMRFTFTDRAGNTSEFSAWPFVIDQQTDIPVVEISLPEDNDVITTDFTVSGIMFDDDGIKNIQWRIDSGAWQTLEAQNGFSIPISFAGLTDNAHTITVIAEDIYGVRSAPVVRNFRVSRAEPAMTITAPLFDTVLKDVIEIRGSAFDRNGIKEVKISVDNGNTFNAAIGNFGTTAETVQWNYRFNTKILKDGAHVVFIRILDNYDIPATYASMINVDNTPPDITLESPADGSFSTGRISVMGRVLDPNLQEVSIQLRALDGQQVSPALRSRTLAANMLIRENFDLSAQADGHYNIAVVATDKAGNITRVSRNFELARQTYRNFLEVLYPLENEVISGEFNLYGYAGGADKAGTATIRINGRDVATNTVDESGYFNFNLSRENLREGNNTVIVMSNFGGNTQVSSRSYNIVYKNDGPWVTIDSFSFGEFAYERPYLYGRTGYVLNEADIEALASRDTPREARTAIQAKAVSKTEISFDNGRTFKSIISRKTREYDYRFRLETGDMTEGMHYIVVRSTMKNGEIAITRMLVQVDKTPPVIKLISPEMGGRYNTEIVYSASATDDIELISLTYHLRRGDKSAYEIPGFLQGLYLEAFIPPFVRQLLVENGATPSPDWTKFLAGGATYMDIGIGLSFFDDNVKVQASYGFLTQELYENLGGEGRIRYGGQVLGIKMLATLYRLPFGSFMGPDWEWLSATFAIGANFSYFNFPNEENPKYTSSENPVYYTQSGTPTWMSALLFQIEFPRITIPKQKYFRTFSLFTEGQLWFVPTDVDADKNNIPVVLPKVVVGLRIYIF